MEMFLANNRILCKHYRLHHDYDKILLSTFHSRLNSTRNAKRANTVKSVASLNLMMLMMQVVGIPSSVHLF